MPDTPPDDRQQVQSVRTASLPLIQQAKYPRDALYALLRQANLDVLGLLREHTLTSDGEFQVEVTVRTTAVPRPHSAPTAAELQAQGYAVGAPEPGER